MAYLLIKGEKTILFHDLQTQTKDNNDNLNMKLFK